MLYDIYSAVKIQLNTADTEGELKGIEWYNVQYEGSIPNTPRVFIEFPDRLPFDQVTKQTRRAPLKIRCHVVTQALVATHGEIPDALAQEHEDTVYLVLDALDKFTPDKAGIKLTSPLQFSGWEHFHKHKGWMVTFVEFDCKKIL
jgi:hypothetical protein